MNNDPADQAAGKKPGIVRLEFAHPSNDIRRELAGGGFRHVMNNGPAAGAHGVERQRTQAIFKPRLRRFFDPGDDFSHNILTVSLH